MSEAKVRQELEKCFDFVDADGSGYLDAAELLKVALKYNEEHQGCGCKKSEDEVKVGRMIQNMSPFDEHS